MKSRIYIFKFISALTIYFFIVINDTPAQQSNFQIAPSPIAYPYFEEGRSDGTFGFSYISIKTDDIKLAGGAGDFKGRIAFFDFAAIDCDLGINAMGGSMPGLPPITTYYWDMKKTQPFMTEVEGDASLTFLSSRMAFNLEIQPIHTDLLSMILFGGPNVNLSNFSMETPVTYSYIAPYTTTTISFRNTANTLTINTTLTGWQCGIQLDIPIYGDLRISPFYMYSSFSGNATMSETNSYQGDGDSMDFDVPDTTSTSYGMDIVYGDFSIGTLIQQMTSSKEDTQDAKIIMISISYHFSSEENNL